MSESATVTIPLKIEDDERHRREEAERRAKRKASKDSRSDSHLEKDRKRKEYRQKILLEQGASTAGDSSSAGSKRHKPIDQSSTTGSVFQDLFTQRAQGFQIEFRFRNAPPRPPVGPCFVGNSLDSLLAEQGRHYKALNAVEVNHTWKLHCEPDVGVPLAPTAIDSRSYARPNEDAVVALHPDDEALLNWTGSLGDTAADELKRRQEQARVAARLAVSGRSPDAAIKSTKAGHVEKVKKNVFSRMLKEDMQTWMKKTTYLSNDYSRKVHDFKSLAQTKSELATDLQSKQVEMSVRRSVKSIVESFSRTAQLVNPTNTQLKAKRVFSVLPDTHNWGRAFTHVVIDKPPTSLPAGYANNDLDHAFVTNVEKQQSNARLTCNMIVPATEMSKSDDADADAVEGTKRDFYRPVQSFDLDIFPLKDEDMPHMNFCMWLDGDIARYIPVASRVALAVGRPSKSTTAHLLERRPRTDKETTEIEEKMAEVDQDMAEKHHMRKERNGSKKAAAADNGGTENYEDDDGEDDFGDDDSDEEEVFGGGKRTIVAES